MEESKRYREKREGGKDREVDRERTELEKSYRKRSYRGEKF